MEQPGFRKDEGGKRENEQGQGVQTKFLYPVIMTPSTANYCLK